MLMSVGPSISCFFRALVDSSIIVESELEDDPLDTHDGDHSVKDEPSEEDSLTLLSKNAHTALIDR